LRRKFHPMPGMRGCHNLQREASAAQPIDRRRRKFPAPPAARRRIHHRKKLRFQVCPKFPDA
jgi:hypothetical protein